jgi:hypothetical protein
LASVLIVYRYSPLTPPPRDADRTISKPFLGTSRECQGIANNFVEVQGVVHRGD